MALAIKVASLDGLADGVKSLYIPVPESEGTGFKLDLDGYEDPISLKTALSTERKTAADATKSLREILKKYEGMPDPEKLRAIMNQLENDEEQKLIAEGKLPEVVKLRTEKMRLELERVAAEATDKAAKAETKATKFEMQVLKGHLSLEAMQEGIGVHPSAIKYIFSIAKEDGWRLDDDGNPRLYDKTGEVVLGKDGKTPYSFSEWLKDPKTIADNPTWYTAGNSGGGAGGNTSKTTGKVDTSKMSPEEKLTHARQNKT